MSKQLTTGWPKSARCTLNGRVQEYVTAKVPNRCSVCGELIAPDDLAAFFDAVPATSDRPDLSAAVACLGCAD
jgi:hypothetical protein